MNPNLSKNSRSYSDWIVFASEANERSNTQAMVSLGIAGGIALAALTSSPVLGLVPVVWGFTSAWRSANRQSANDEAIDRGCIAHLLPERRFHLYLNQYGEAEILQQLAWAEEEGYPLSPVAQSFLEYVQNRQQEAEGKVTTTKSEASEPPVSDRPNPQLTDLALAMAKRLTSRITCAAPRTGKGMLLSTAAYYLTQLRPDVELWALDLKNDPKEDGYYSIFHPDRLLRIDLMGFEIPSDAGDRISDFFQRFNQSQVTTKLIWLNEGVTAASKLPAQLWTNIKNFAVGLCSAGATGDDGQTGRFIWFDTQSPNVTDLGMKTNAARNVFRRIFLMNDDRSLLPSAVSSGFIPREPTEVEWADLRSSGSQVYAYDSLIDAWVGLPDYRKLSEAPTTSPTTSETFDRTSQKPEAVEAQGESDLPDFRRYFPEAAEAAEKLLFEEYKQHIKAGKGRKEFIELVLQAGSGGRKYQAAAAYITYLCRTYGRSK